jgi:steroid delta-isomerase-like uncharacterized protein
MKITTAFCLAALLFSGGWISGCAEEPADPQPPAEDLVRALFAAWSEHDPDPIDVLFPEDGIYEDVPPQRTYRGPEEIKGFLTAIWAWAPDIEFDLTSVAVAGDRAVAEWVMTGTQTGPIGAIPASGNQFSVRGASVLEIRDGKITRNSDYYDLASLLVQFGVRYAAPPPKGQSPQ